MKISHKDNNNTIQVYSVTIMTHVKALEAEQYSQGTSEPRTPEQHVYFMTHSEKRDLYIGRSPGGVALLINVSHFVE